MHILVLGGTRYFGIPMVEELLAMGHDVTIATIVGRYRNKKGTLKSLKVR